MIEDIDALLLAQTKTAWQKVAIVIARAMKDGQTWSEEKLGERIVALVESGKIESRGDVRNWRFSEVRLPVEVLND